MGPSVGPPGSSGQWCDVRGVVKPRGGRVDLETASSMGRATGPGSRYGVAEVRYHGARNHNVIIVANWSEKQGEVAAEEIGCYVTCSVLVCGFSL